MKNQKKLILNFTEKTHEKEQCENVIIISANEKSCNYIKNSKYYAEIEVGQQDNYATSWKSICCESEVAELLIPHESYVYRRVIRPILIWINTIDLILKNNNVDEIFIDSIRNGEEIFLYEAEGEVNKHFLYKCDYYIPVMLNKYLKNKYEVITIHGNYKSKITKKLSYYMRNISFLGYIFFRKMKGAASTYIAKEHNIKNKKIVISTRSLAQESYVGSLINEFDDAIILSNSQIVKHVSSDSADLDSIEKIYVDKFITRSKVVQLMMRTLYDFFFIKPHDEIDINPYLSIPSKYIIKDIIIRSLDFSCYQVSFSNALKVLDIKPTLIVSCDMFSPHSYFLPKIKSLRKIQLQTSLINDDVEADFVYSDKFYFQSNALLNKMKEKNPDIAYKFDFLPPLQYLNTKSKNKIDNIKSIVYFTQPIFVDEQLDLLQVLANYCAEKNIKLSLKPHPRESLIDFKPLGIEILNKNISNVKIINENDLVITRNSSIGTDCWAINTPVIFIRNNEELKKTVTDYIPVGYIGDVSDVHFAISMIENTAFLNGFYSIRSEMSMELSKEEILKRFYRESECL